MVHFVYVYSDEWRFIVLNNSLIQLSLGKFIDQPSTTRSKPHENKLQMAPASSFHATDETIRR